MKQVLLRSHGTCKKEEYNMCSASFAFSKMPVLALSKLALFASFREYAYIIYVTGLGELSLCFRDLLSFFLRYFFAGVSRGREKFILPSHRIIPRLHRRHIGVSQSPVYNSKSESLPPSTACASPCARSWRIASSCKW